jgi:hypothetical protein
MDWLNQIGGMLQQYSSGAGSQSSAEEDFDHLARNAPPQEVAHGLAESFRSSETPPFPNMLGQLFGNSNGSQRAGVLNTLLATAGPALLSSVLSRHGSGLGGLLGGLSGGQGQAQLTPEQAERIPPEAVKELAAEAEKKDPSVIDRVSDFYAQQPQVVKTLGAAALGVALMQIGRKHKLL